MQNHLKIPKKYHIQPNLEGKTFESGAQFYIWLLSFCLATK